MFNIWFVHLLASWYVFVYPENYVKYDCFWSALELSGTWLKITDEQEDAVNRIRTCEKQCIVLQMKASDCSGTNMDCNIASGRKKERLGGARTQVMKYEYTPSLVHERKM